MGIAVAHMRLIFLTLQKTDIEYKLMLISQTKMNLTNSVNDLLTVGTDLDSDSPEYKTLRARQEKLMLIDKRLEEQMQRYKSKLSMVETELESVDKMLNNNIKRAFTYGGG